MASENVYWIGDNKNEKSALIGKKFYLPGDVIPVDEVEKSRLENWKVKGLVSGGVYSPPVIIKDKETVKRLETEARDLKVKLDAMPALVNQNAEMKAEIAKMSGLKHEITELKSALEQARSGKKADKLKALETHIEELNESSVKQSDRIKELEDADLEAGAEIDALKLDNQEKAALIDKLNADLEEATAPHVNAGPGGNE